MTLKTYTMAMAFMLVLLAFGDIVKSSNGAQKILNNNNDIAMYTAKDYVQNGLVAIWDGIENVGFGVHDDEAVIWKDCINRREYVGINTIYDGMSYRSKGGNVAATTFTYADLVDVERTREVVFKANAISFSNDPVLSATGDRSLDFAIWAQRDMRLIAFYRNGTKFLDVGVDEAYQPYCLAVVNKASSTYGYVNGIETKNSSSFFAQQGNAYFPATTQGNDITIFAFRVYNRALTEKEIYHNHLIDKARFNLQ